MPAPPPNGVSSTWPPLSGLWSRGFSVRTSCPPASALATWRWARNHSNHSGKSVTTSSCIVSLPRARTPAPFRRGTPRRRRRPWPRRRRCGPRPGRAGPGTPRRRRFAENRHVDVDALALDVGAAARAREEGDQKLLAAAGPLERLTGGQRDEPQDAPELPVAVDDAAAHEVLRPPLVVLERRGGRARGEQLQPAQPPGRGPAPPARGPQAGAPARARAPPPARPPPPPP